VAKIYAGEKVLDARGGSQKKGLVRVTALLPSKPGKIANSLFQGPPNEGGGSGREEGGA